MLSDYASITRNPSASCSFAAFSTVVDAYIQGRETCGGWQGIILVLLPFFMRLCFFSLKSYLILFFGSCVFVFIEKAAYTTVWQLFAFTKKSALNCYLHISQDNFLKVR